MKQITAILIGAGLRGRTYTQYALRHPDELKVVAVAEPLDDRRNSIKELHSLDEANCYTDWKDILNRPKFADVSVICTIGESSNNHMIAFAAERSRVEGRVVNMDEYASLMN